MRTTRKALTALFLVLLGAIGFGVVFQPFIQEQISLLGKTHVPRISSASNRHVELVGIPTLPPAQGGFDSRPQTAAWTMVAYDAFQNGDSIVQTGAEWNSRGQVEDGQLVLSAESDETAFGIVAGSGLSDVKLNVRLQADFSRLKTSGLVCRYSSRDDYAFVALGAKGAQGGYVAGGTMVELPAIQVAPDFGDWLQNQVDPIDVLFTCQDKLLFLEVNNKPIAVFRIPDAVSINGRGSGFFLHAGDARTINVLTLRQYAPVRVTGVNNP